MNFAWTHPWKYGMGYKKPRNGGGMMTTEPAGNSFERDIQDIRQRLESLKEETEKMRAISAGIETDPPLISLDKIDEYDPLRVMHEVLSEEEQ